MLWKDRLSWKQYIPSNKARYGIKSFEISESSSCYIWDFVVYTGKNTEFNSACEQESSVGAKAILTLAHNLLDKAYCVSMDNRFFHQLSFLHCFAQKLLIQLELCEPI